MNAYIKLEAHNDDQAARSFIAVLLRELDAFCANKNFSLHVIDEDYSGVFEYTKTAWKMEGENAYESLSCDFPLSSIIAKYLATPTVPPALSVWFFPELVDDSILDISNNDLIVNYSSKNRSLTPAMTPYKGDVRILHMPSSTVVECNRFRNGSSNFNEAKQLLRAQLFAIRCGNQPKPLVKYFE